MKSGNSNTRKKPSIKMAHYVKLAIRTVLFVALLWLYVRNGAQFVQTLKKLPVLLAAVWGMFVTEIVVRLFSTRFVSPGSQKHLVRNYIPTGQPITENKIHRYVLNVALAWIGFNLIFGGLYLANVIDRGFMILLSAAYAVCDEVCILFFCPFHQWFLHHQCCTVCRMYNWNFTMIFTPLIFVPGIYTWSLLALALALLVQWELAAHRHPECFLKQTNDYLSCQRCTDKICLFKKQIKKS
jgi:hypothetical protein